jgi:hypothetical protein
VHNHELKLAWAEHHFEVFEGQVGAWRAADGYGVVFESQPNSPRHVMRLKADETPPVLSLVLGDALFIMRSALDHLAYTLAVAHSGPLPADVAEKVEFPIFGDRPMRSDERRRKIGALHPDAATAIEDLQPHKRRDGCADDPLWWLHELARIDRHRLLHLTVAQLRSVGIGGDNVRIEGLVIEHVGPGAVDGTELGSCSVRPINPGRPMQMNVTPEPDIIFKEGLVSGRSVLEVLREIHRHINEEVLPPLSPFLVRRWLASPWGIAESLPGLPLE